MAIIVKRYNTAPRQIGAGRIDPGFANPLIRDASQNGTRDLVDAMLKAGMQITEVGIREYVKSESTAVSEALQEYRESLAAERERYTKANQGKNAVNAGAHFDQFARETAQPLIDRFSGRFKEMFIKGAAPEGLRFTEQGRAYGSQQRQAWEKSVFDGDMAQTLSEIAADPDNNEFLYISLTSLKERHASMFPGLDQRAFEADVNRKVASLAIDSLLARDNISGARTAFGEYRELLGVAAPQYEARIRTAAKAMEAQARAAERERLADVKLTAAGFADQIAYGVDKGDFSAAENTLARLQQMGATQEAAKLSAQLQLSKEARTAVEGEAGLPLLTQLENAKASLDAMVTPDNARDVIKVRDNTLAALQQKIAHFPKDPAGHVAQNPALQGEMDFQERTRRSLALQDEMGRGLAFVPRVLSEQQRKAMRAEYDKLTTPEARVQWYRGIQQEAGQYTSDILREMGLPEAVQKIAPALTAISDKNVGIYLTASEIKAGDIPGVTSDSKRQAQDSTANSQIIQNMLAMVQRFPTNQALMNLGKGMEETMTKAVLLGMNPEDLDREFSFSTSDNCALMLPAFRNIDAEYLAEELNMTWRGKIADKLAASLPQAATPRQRRVDEANMRAIAEQGIFVSDERGQFVLMVNPWTGGYVAKADGTPLRLNVDEIMRDKSKNELERQRNEYLSGRAW